MVETWKAVMLEKGWGLLRERAEALGHGQWSVRENP